MNNKYYDEIIEQFKKIDTTDLSDDVQPDVTSVITEQQKTYFWIRLYLNDDNINAEIGDDITIKYTPSGEQLITKFICYDKKGLSKDHQGEMTNYNAEDDKKIMCLMIEDKLVNNNDDIPFIRTLFKTGHFYEYQLMKRDELQFTIDKNGLVFDYYDVDF